MNHREHPLWRKVYWFAKKISGLQAHIRPESTALRKELHDLGELLAVTVTLAFQADSRREKQRLLIDLYFDTLAAMILVFALALCGIIPQKKGALLFLRAADVQGRILSFIRGEL